MPRTLVTRTCVTVARTCIGAPLTRMGCFASGGKARAYPQNDGTAFEPIPLARLVGAITVALIAACGTGSSVDDVRRSELSQSCALNSDCNAPLVCAFTSCHVECSSSRDCPNGARCVQSDKPYLICQNETDIACTRNSDCPGIEVCGIDDKCRDACATDRDCPKDQSCRSGTCADKSDLVGGTLPLVIDTGSGTPCVHASDSAARSLLPGAPSTAIAIRPSCARSSPATSPAAPLATAPTVRAACRATSRSSFANIRRMYHAYVMATAPRPRCAESTSAAATHA